MIDKPLYKIGDIIVIKLGIVYKIEEIIGGYINEKETLNDWNYYTTNDKEISVKQSSIIYKLN